MTQHKDEGREGVSPAGTGQPVNLIKLAKDIAIEVGGNFADTHSLNTGLNKFIQRASQLPPAWECKARKQIGDIGPQDCDWPFCGCDPKADKVIEAIEESGFKIVRDSVKGEGETADTEHGMSSEELGQQFGKFFKPAPPESAPSPEELAREIVRVVLSNIAADGKINVVSARVNVAALLRPRLERAEQWIPVEERLPKMDELPCLVWRGTTHRIEVGRPMPPIGKGTQDKWRPLPATPDTEKKA